METDLHEDQQDDKRDACGGRYSTGFGMGEIVPS